MTLSQKRVLWALVTIGLVYFAVFIFPNILGAKDANMLGVFETDEYAQYPNVIRMLTPGATFYQSIRNFTVYLHYFYGYPFYFFSALALLPLKLALGAGWASSTPLIVLFLRQLIKVLPMIVSVGLLVWIQTRFRPAWLAIGLFLFLLFVPALVVNNFWWHPDSLLVLFVVLTFFFLDRDDQRFGWNFFLAAVTCGLATGTKHLGLFFFVAIPLYLAWGWMNKKIRLGRAAGFGGLFVLVMVAAILFSNPLLFLPQERAAIIATQQMQWVQTTQGYWTVNLSPFFNWGQYPDDFRQHYGELFFILLSLVTQGLGLLRKERRLLHLIILAWIVPFT
ncbi:MAG TPA: phospholipid carrier-dependent glycosyltransferase, partial [Anaerolineaceae bacterium]